MSRVDKPRDKYVNLPHYNQSKSKSRRNTLLEERDEEYKDAMGLLASIGVPFGPDGTPLGIGWDE